MAGDDSKAPKPEEIEHQQHDAIRQHELRDAEALRAIHPEIPLEEVLESHTELDSKRVKRIIRKLDFRLISILGLVYVWAFIDRGNLGNVRMPLHKRLTDPSRIHLTFPGESCLADILDRPILLG